MGIADGQVTGEISKQIVFNCNKIRIRNGWDISANKGGEVTVASKERQNILALTEFVLRSQQICKRAKFIPTLFYPQGVRIEMLQRYRRKASPEIISSTTITGDFEFSPSGRPSIR